MTKRLIVGKCQYEYLETEFQCRVMGKRYCEAPYTDEAETPYCKPHAALMAKRNRKERTRFDLGLKELA